MSEKNAIKVYTTSNGAELNISAPSTKQVISATNNRAQYFAEQAKKYKEEAKQYRDNAKFYAEQNSDVTYEYIDQVKSVLEEKISEKQPVGNYALKEELPINVSELKNDAEYVNQEELDNAISEVELPPQEGCKGCFLMSNGEDEIWVGLNTFSLFDTKVSDRILLGEDSKGWALQGTYVYREAIAGSRYGYPDFYNKCLEEKESATITEVALGDTTITMYVNANGHQYYDIANKDIVDAFFETMGSAWFYGIDIENERIFLPRNNWFDQATGEVSDVGQSVAAGLPNITGSFYNANNQDHMTTASGAFASTTVHGNAGAKYGNWGSSTTFDASRSSSVYGNSDTVQPNAVKKLLYICVGNTESQSTITDVVEVTTAENDTIPLFLGMYFDFTPNNVSWLNAGEQANSGGIYSFTYNELVNVLNGETKYGCLKVINVVDMENGVDYSEYWKVNQDDMTFITPVALASASSEQSSAQLYFKVANAVQNLELLDAGEVLEAVAGIVPNNKEIIMDYVVPDILNQMSYSVTSNSIIDFPVNGWIRISANGNASFAMGAKGVTSTAYCPYRYYRNQEAYQELWMPVAKGEHTILDAVNVAEVFFIPMKGAN